MIGSISIVLDNLFKNSNNLNSKSIFNQNIDFSEYSLSTSTKVNKLFFFKLSKQKY